MTSWAAWLVLLVVAVTLGVIATHFSVRTVRWFTAVVAVGLVIVVAAYGLNSAVSLGMPASGPPDLQTAFAKGADAIAAALLRPLWLGHQVPEPGRVGWAVICALLLLGYRQVEAWALARQAPVVDTSQLSDGQPSILADAAAHPGLTDGQRHDQLAAELKFRLAAMELRAPAILPGGSRSSGLASIAEDSGVAGAGLAGAIIRFLGLLWPGPARWTLRVWVEPPPGAGSADKSTRVTAELDDPRTGTTVASKTIVAPGLDDAASMVAGYVARQVLGRDPTAPLWCYGASDGRDLGAMLLARQERVYADSWEAVRASRLAQIRLLRTVTDANRCAGLVRYEQAQLLDLGRDHLTALRLHALNREQYPRFFRGRYRLAMSLEMAANPGQTFPDPEMLQFTLTQILTVLYRCGLASHSSCVQDDIAPSEDAHGQYRISDALSLELLDAAAAELAVIRRQLTLPAVSRAALVHRDERTVWRPHRSLRVRQSFRDGVSVAELLVAVRILLNDPGRLPSSRLRRYRRALRITTAVTGDRATVEAVFRLEGPQDASGAGRPSARSRWARLTRTPLRMRMLPWRRYTPSWQAAYNTACIYSALTQHGLAGEEKVVASLQHAIDSRDSEMERPYDWIFHDPDFLPLKNSPRDKYPDFKKFLRDQKRNDYPNRPRAATTKGRPTPTIPLTPPPQVADPAAGQP
ncbi:MAG TPA: hypothetical protein VI365_04615 [Trebonia sp.]